MPTLEQLDGEIWGEPEFKSSLVVTCHGLRKKPIDEFTGEDLRVMIAQGIGLPYLLPLAFSILNSDPLTDVGHYPGDLMNSLISVRREFYEQNPTFLAQAISVVDQALSRIRGSGDDYNLAIGLQNFLERYKL